MTVNTAVVTAVDYLWRISDAAGHLSDGYTGVQPTRDACSLTSLLTGMRHVFDPQGDWISFAQANLQIETEVVRYKQALDEYGDEAAAPGILAVRVENIAAVETGTWAQRLPRPAAPSTSSGSSG
ncbi:hypothetical protein [Streptomyces sp. CA-210063]|uniref:hypothetical protein n=1 Tax=Streptomyces sp. CA-210063 TaxID=2801029 RepID=UPI003FA6896D